MVYRLAGLLLAFCGVLMPALAAQPQPALKMPLATDVVFLGLASAGDRIVAVGERGAIIGSDDGGASWQQADVPTRATLTAVAFVDANVGFAVGHDAVVLKTTDAGVSWTLLNFEPDSQTALLNVRFRDARNGYVVGSNGQLWNTNDGGANWQRRTLAVEDWYQNHIFDIAWTPDGSTVAVAEKGVLYRSADGGDPFGSIESPYDGSYFGALALRDGRLLIYGMNGHAFVSADGGLAWQRIDTGTEQFLFAAALLPDGAPVLVGGGGVVVHLVLPGLRAGVHQLRERAGITAVLPVGDVVYLATVAGGVQRRPLDELID